jgi:chaperonin cofactor prefoldin
MDWDSLKILGNWIWYLILPVLGWFLREQFSEAKIMKQKISDLEVRQAVTDSQIKDIRGDIQDLNKVVRDAEKRITEDLKDLGKEIRNGLQHNSNKY